jgi:hypothetical protein
VRGGLLSLSFLAEGTGARAGSRGAGAARRARRGRGAGIPRWWCAQ